MQNTTPSPPSVTREQAEATIAKLNTPEERAALLRRVTLRRCFFDGNPRDPGAGANKALVEAMETKDNSAEEGKNYEIVEKAVTEFQSAQEKLRSMDQSAMLALADQIIPTMAADNAAMLALNPPKLPT